MKANITAHRHDKLLCLRSAIASDDKSGVSVSTNIATGAILVDFKGRGTVEFKLEDLVEAAAELLAKP